jgi:diacylglycerol kinase (ATP)
MAANQKRQSQINKFDSLREVNKFDSLREINKFDSVPKIKKQSFDPQQIKSLNYKLIYNPNAGKKRNITHIDKKAVSLEQIKFLLEKYQIPVDFYPTKSPGHATQLATDAIKEGYKGVIAAGGDGTIGETANGLIGSDLTLAILPLGSFMNIARMLAIPFDLEKAVQLIKIERIRKIDVGAVVKMDNSLLKTTHYFLESAGVGLQAQLHDHLEEIDKGNLKELISLFKSIKNFYNYPVNIKIDNQSLELKVSAIAISNAPFTGASLKLAPKAKLNDHLLTITVFKIGKFELLRAFFRYMRGERYPSHKITTYQGKQVIIKSKKKILLHIDGRLFGHTDAEFKIVPNALNAITGFPDPKESYLEKRTILDP